MTSALLANPVCTGRMCLEACLLLLVADERAAHGASQCAVTVVVLGEGALDLAVLGDVGNHLLDGHLGVVAIGVIASHYVLLYLASNISRHTIAA